MRQPKTPSAVRDEAYHLAMLHARERASEGDPKAADAIRDLAASISLIRLTVDKPNRLPIIGDLALNVRLAQTLGTESPATLVGEVLDDDAHPLRSKLSKSQLRELEEVRQESGLI